MKKQIPASELPLQSDGAIYHLNLHPEELADNVILVGDPGRVAMISDLFDSVDIRKQNRELITHTGMYKGKRISVISTGMGTDNIDIVLTELDAVANIDLATRTVKEEHRPLNLVRIGTSGALHPDIHQKHVGMMLLIKRDSFLTACTDGCDLDFARVFKYGLK